MIGFIMMQIGDPSLDRICAEAIVPALEANQLLPRRVDKHNEGGLLKSEIIQFINDAGILIADLTNERPNVYLEVGYAMGAGRFRHLILTVRQDHFLDNPDRQPGDPRVHFDLSGYDILAWDPEDIPAFRSELTKRIARRLALVGPTSDAAQQLWDQTWLNSQWSAATQGVMAIKGRGRMEIRAAVYPPKLECSLAQLRDAARSAPIDTLGWPIGVFLTNVDESRPKPTADGIVASVTSRFDNPSYDFWALRRNGDFYLIKSIFEDERKPEEMFLDIRIMRVTEALMYLLRLYAALGVDRSRRMAVRIRHSGLRGRVLGSASGSRYFSMARRTAADESVGEVAGTLDEIEADLVGYVKQILHPLFELFDFFEPADQVYEDTVNRFVEGRV